MRRLVATRGAAILVWDSADERIIEAYWNNDEEFAELRAHSNGAPFLWLQSRTGTLTPVRALVNDLWVSADGLMPSGSSMDGSPRADVGRIDRG